MTEERRNRNMIKAQALTDIILWSFENRELWNHICLKDENGMGEYQTGEALDRLGHDGHMALYYIILTRIAGITQTGLENKGKFLDFLKGTIDQDFWPDMDRIEATLKMDGLDMNLQ